MTTRIFGALDDHQLFSLRYCFMALDRLERLNRAQVFLTLHILAGNMDDAFRIQHYLAAMTVFRKISLVIFYEEKRLMGLRKLTSDYYRIMPLFCVGVEEWPWTVRYLEMVNSGDVNETEKLIRTCYQKKLPATTVHANQSVKIFLEQTLMKNLWRLQQDISGEVEETMKRSDKQALQKELLDALIMEMPRMCLLARLLWTLFLRSLSNSKDLFYRDKDYQWHMNMETFRCTRLDAASYAEGILQLLENACIHSEMKRAYITLRLSDTDITGSGVMRVANAAQTRADIREHHRQLWSGGSAQLRNAVGQGAIPEYKLDRQAKYCLEFSVLNDSSSSSGELLGITSMFAKNRKIDSTSKTLTEVFSYQCEKMSDISKHYGLRLLEKTVQLNGGFFSVCSPGVDGTQER